jgi:hypothetical protein
MFRRRLTGPAGALALAAMSSSIAFAQSELESARASLVVGHEVPVPGTLKAAYHVRLTSTWPQEMIAGCRNGGQETVEGTLTRQTDGTYSGTFTRSTQLLFCGAHGPQGASARSCALTLQGDGRVAMTGVVVEDGSSPSGRAARVEWTPVPGHAAAVSGACPAAFMQALQRMYLTARHAAEFPLTTAGAGRRSERLDDYAWSVEVE